MTDGAEGRDAIALIGEVRWTEQLGERIRVEDDFREVNIRYNSKNPSIAVVKGEQSTEARHGWFAVVAMGIAVLLLTLRISSRRRRHTLD